MRLENLNTINQSINQYSHTSHRKKPLLLYMYQSERKLERQGTEIQPLIGRLNNKFPFKLW